MPTEMSHVVSMLRARDMTETIAFYAGKLGFIVTNQVKREDGTPQWCYLLRGAAALMFYAEPKAVDPTGMTGCLYFYPRDIAAEWERLKELVPVICPLQATTYGMREFVIRDPNGYELRYGQETR